MANPTGDEIGYSINLPGGVGDKATPATLSNFLLATASVFAIVMNVCFLDDNYNIFFGGLADGESLYLSRNKTAGKIDLELTDSAANQRLYTWDAPLVRGKWYQIIINGTANEADGIKLYVDGIEQTASAQTNDAGYLPTTSLPMNFGDVDAVNLGGLKLANPYFYVTSFTADEITTASRLKKLPEGEFYSWKFKRPNIGLNKAITLVA